MLPCIFNIQKFSLHDGPGIRTVVFFKGCPLRCKWCSNPESQDFKPQVLYDASKCIKCLHCIQCNKAHNITLQNNSIHIAFYDEQEDYETLCPNQALHVEGCYESYDTIVNEVLKDKDFYEESKGGVTLSGGEVLAQARAATILCKQLKQHNLHIAVETTGYASADVFQEFIKEIDLLLFDMKHYDSSKHEQSCGVPNEQIIKNMKYAVQSGKEVIARIPIIPTFNNTLEDANNVAILLKEIGIKKVNLLPFHQFGTMKYEQLHKEYTMKSIPQLHPEDVEDFKNILLDYGFDCTI